MRADGTRKRNGASPRAGPLLRLSIEADACAIRHALAAVVSALGPLRLSPECTGDIELVLAEVLNNIQRHAYGGKPGPIELDLAVAEGSLVCTVVDCGTPMPGGDLPAGRAVALDVRPDALPEGGFGWFLIRSHARSLVYHREAGRNRLILHLPMMVGERAGSVGMIRARRR